ncbi:MAG TPA: branched-chain amino acid ABC transporter permease [Candidatus Limnocylindrales bacterium]|nr:branched-chain amino acid ABC transporter permease [Candidatus Limnocylindrales bacterium]
MSAGPGAGVVGTATARPSTAFRVERGTLASRLTAIVGLVLLAILAAVPAWGTSGMMKLLVEFLTLLAMAQMWNLLAGFAGLVSIGQQAFVGVGAYGIFVFLNLVHTDIVVALAGTAIVGLGVAAVTSLFAFRLRDGYFAVGTWVIAEVIRILILLSPALGAGTGVTIRPPAGLSAGGRLDITYWLALVVGFGSIAVVALIMRSRLGLALRAIRDGEMSAASVGVNVQRTKRIVFLVAAVGCAVAGAVYYLQLLRIQPNAAFGVDWTARMIFIVVIGGLGRIEGPIVGAIVYFTLREVLADYGAAYLAALGLVAIAVVVIAPRGLWGVVESRLPALFAVQRRLVVTEPPATSSIDSRKEPGPT